MKLSVESVKSDFEYLFEQISFDIMDDRLGIPKDARIRIMSQYDTLRHYLLTRYSSNFESSEPTSQPAKGNLHLFDDPDSPAEQKKRSENLRNVIQAQKQVHTTERSITLNHLRMKLIRREPLNDDDTATLRGLRKAS